MDQNTANVIIAIVTMIGAVLGPVMAQWARRDIRSAKTDVRQDISAVKNDLAYNTQKTDNTNEIVNGQRDKMVKEIADLQRQLAAVNAVLALQRAADPKVAKVVDQVDAAVEAVKA